MRLIYAVLFLAIMALILMAGLLVTSEGDYHSCAIALGGPVGSSCERATAVHVVAEIGTAISALVALGSAFAALTAGTEVRR